MRGCPARTRRRLRRGIPRVASTAAAAVSAAACSAAMTTRNSRSVVRLLTRVVGSNRLKNRIAVVGGSKPSAKRCRISVMGPEVVEDEGAIV
jgi:hypothetical protein